MNACRPAILSRVKGEFVSVMGRTWHTSTNVPRNGGVGPEIVMKRMRVGSDLASKLGRGHKSRGFIE